MAVDRFPWVAERARVAPYPEPTDLVVRKLVTVLVSDLHDDAFAVVNKLQRNIVQSNGLIRCLHDLGFGAPLTDKLQGCSRQLAKYLRYVSELDVCQRQPLLP